MVMKICPNCLVGVSKKRRLCHQCGHDIYKRPASKSRNTVSKNKSYRPMLCAMLWVILLAIGYVAVI